MLRFAASLRLATLASAPPRSGAPTAKCNPTGGDEVLPMRWGDSKLPPAHSISHPVGRAAQATACKAAKVGATPTRDSMYLRDANTGAGQDFTDLAAAVQLRLRVASGLQALQRCSGFLSRRARGSTVATHHLFKG